MSIAITITTRNDRSRELPDERRAPLTLNLARPQARQQAQLLWGRSAISLLIFHLGMLDLYNWAVSTLFPELAQKLFEKILTQMTDTSTKHSF